MATAKKEIEDNESEKPQTEIVVPPGTPVDVIDNTNPGKRATYRGYLGVNPNEINNEAKNQIGEDFSESLFNNQIEENKRFAFPQTLTEFAACLSHFAGQELYLVVTRLTDAYDEKYSFAAKRELQFAPVPFDAGSILFSLVDILHKLNHNSGGRFKIEVANRSGETMDDVFLVNFAVPDPMRSDSEVIANSNHGNSENNNFLLLVNEMREDRKMLFELIQNQNTQPQNQPQSLMEQLAVLEKLKSITGNSGQDNPMREMMLAMGQGVVASLDLGDMIRERSNRDSGNAEKPSLLDRAMDNPQIVNGALNMANNLTNGVMSIADHLAKQKGEFNANQNNAGNQTVTGEIIDAQETSQPQPQQNPAQQQPPPQPIPQGTQQQMIEQLLAELEGDNPLDLTNTFLTQTLPQNFAMQAQMIAAVCKANDDFEKVFEMIERFIPPEIMARYEIPDPEDEGEMMFNELGLKMQKRLFEVYTLIRAN